jgi:hypothetical protein
MVPLGLAPKTELVQGLSAGTAREFNPGCAKITRPSLNLAKA